jgi:hypothetical protein
MNDCKYFFIHIPDATAELGCVLSVCCTGVCSIVVGAGDCCSDSPVGVKAALFNSIEIRLLNELRASTIVSEINHKNCRCAIKMIQNLTRFIFTCFIRTFRTAGFSGTIFIF